MSITVTVPSDDKRALALAGEFFSKLAGHIDETLPDSPREAYREGYSDGANDALSSEPINDEPIEPPAPQTNEPTTDLDANGLPWDARIHASTKTRNADGSWRNKRGVDKAVVEQIEQELRDLMAIPVQDEPVAPPPPPVDDKQPDTPADFPSFLRAVSKMMTEGTTSQEQVNNVLRKHGIASMPLVAARADLIPQLWDDIVADAAQ